MTRLVSVLICGFAVALGCGVFEKSPLSAVDAISRARECADIECAEDARTAVCAVVSMLPDSEAAGDARRACEAGKALTECADKLEAALK